MLCAVMFIYIFHQILTYACCRLKATGFKSTYYCNVFFSQNQTTFNFPADNFYRIWRRDVNPCSLEMYRKGFSNIFRFAPKTSKLNVVKQARYFDQPAAHGTHCAEILYSSLFTENGRNLRIIQLYQNKQHA